MASIVKFCKKCRDRNDKDCFAYYHWLRDDCYECPMNICDGTLVDTDFPAEDLSILLGVSMDTDFLYAMIDLHDSAPVEYQLKMSQFRTQAEQQKQQSSTKITCPYCKSDNVSKITVAGRGLSFGLFGFASGKVGKQFHCNKCKSDF